MGVDVAASSFLAFCRSVGVDFSMTLTVGRQSRFGPSERIVSSLSDFDVVADPGRLVRELDGAGGWIDPVFRELGATSVDALDRSDFEGAEVLHDLNEPIPDEFAGRWNCVFDGGVSEHIFRITTSLENTMRLVAPGGHLIVSVPTNQEVGHGLYQVGPELYFRTLVPENGFDLRGVYLHESWPVSRWFRLDDPATVGRRITVGTLGRANLFVLARRVGPAGIVVTPQQSDYAAAWSSGSAPATATSTRAGSRRQRIHRAVGPHLGELLRNVRFVVRSARGVGMDRVRLTDEVTSVRSVPSRR